MTRNIFCAIKNLRQIEQILNQLEDAGVENADVSILFSTEATNMESQRPMAGRDTMQTKERGQQPRRESQSPSQWENKANETTNPRKTRKEGQNAATNMPSNQRNAPAQPFPKEVLKKFSNMGKVNVPGKGTLTGAGPFLNALQSAQGGNLINALTKLGASSNEATTLTEKVFERQNVLLTIRTNDPSLLDQVKVIFEKNGASSIIVTPETATTSGKSSQW